MPCTAWLRRARRWRRSTRCWPWTPSSAPLATLRIWLATTVGYGPRFLHSTGQLHKGDAGHGLFIQFTADNPRDAPIPDEAGSLASTMTFGVLKAAQAMGDRQALLNAGRRVIRFHLGGGRRDRWAEAVKQVATKTRLRSRQGERGCITV